MTLYQALLVHRRGEFPVEANLANFCPFELGFSPVMTVASSSSISRGMKISVGSVVARNVGIVSSSIMVDWVAWMVAATENSRSCSTG